MAATDHLHPQLFMRAEQARSALRLGPWSNEGGALTHTERYKWPEKPAPAPEDNQPSLDLQFDAPGGDLQSPPIGPRKTTPEYAALRSAYFRRA